MRKASAADTLSRSSAIETSMRAGRGSPQARTGVQPAAGAREDGPAVDAQLEGGVPDPRSPEGHPWQGWRRPPAGRQTRETSRTSSPTAGSAPCTQALPLREPLARPHHRVSSSPRVRHGSARSRRTRTMPWRCRAARPPPRTPGVERGRSICTIRCAAASHAGTSLTIVIGTPSRLHSSSAMGMRSSDSRSFKGSGFSPEVMTYPTPPIIAVGEHARQEDTESRVVPTARQPWRSRRTRVLPCTAGAQRGAQRRAGTSAISAHRARPVDMYSFLLYIYAISNGEGAMAATEKCESVRGEAAKGGPRGKPRRSS